MKIVRKIEDRHNYNMIDLCRFLGAYVVIAYHANPFVDCPDSLGAEILQILSELVVPFYFVATGYFLFIKMKDDKTQKIQRLDSYVWRIVKMYCIATLASLPLTIYGYVVSGNGILSCVLSYIKYFFFVGKLYNSYHLWYLLAVIYAILVIRIMVQKNAKEEHIFIAAFAVYSFFEMMQYAMEHTSQFSGMPLKLIDLYKYVFNTGTIFWGFIYIAIGVLIAKYKKYFKGYICAAGILVIYLLRPHLGSIVNDYMRLLAVALLYMGMMDISLPDRKCFAVMRQMSMMIYLSHLIFLSIYTFLIIGEPNKYGVDTFLFTAAACTIFAGIYYFVQDRIKCRNLS